MIHDPVVDRMLERMFMRLKTPTIEQDERLSALLQSIFTADGTALNPNVLGPNQNILSGFIAPPTAGWTTTGSATFLDGGTYHLLYMTNGGGTNSLKHRKRAMADLAAVNTVIALMQPQIMDTALTSSVFIGMRESGTSKMLLLHFEPDGKVSVKRWTNNTTLSSTPLSSRYYGESVVPPIMMQADLAGAVGLSFYLVQRDGTYTPKIYNEAKTAFFTTAPDEWVWGINMLTGGSQGVGINGYLLSWNDLT